MSRPSGKPFAAAMSGERVIVKLPRSADHDGHISVDASDLPHDTRGQHPIVVVLFGKIITSVA